MTKLEKIKILENVKKQLKQEFVGLDSIIDDLVTSITPWFVTPEVIVRPVVVSLWGMTGTGKSSVVKRLVEILDLKHKTLFFDCGTECNETDYGRNIGDKIVDFINSDEQYGTIDETYSKDLIYVFDEFQYARTIDMSGEDALKPTIRPIWSLLDSGIININDSTYEVNYFKGFVEDFSSFADSHKDTELESLKLHKQEDIEEFLNTLGYFYFDRGVPGDKEYDAYNYYPWEKKDKDKENEPLKVLEDRIIRILLKRSGREIREVVRELYGLHNLGELSEYLKKELKHIQSPKYLDCSKSLIFVIGNLDEAFQVENDTNPDMDADMYYDLTSKVTIMDIKDALKKRFRAEQIARFGNTMIKYPTLKKEHFKKIIESEVQRICAKFKDDKEVEIIPSAEIMDLIYNESVYPVQGVRPTFTTIGTIFTPLLSNIVIQKDMDKNINKVEIKVMDSEKGYKQDKKEIALLYSNGMVDKKEIKLHLGELRNPKNSQTRYICAVHELGHAIMSAYLTGNVPSLIVSVSATSGGFCMTYDSDREREIRSRKDIQNDVMIGLAGYEAEILIYGDKDRCLLGSGNDINDTWSALRNSAYKFGYFSPFEFRNYEVQSSDLPGGLCDDEIVEKLRAEFDRLEGETKRILRGNLGLIKKAALQLGESGSMTGNEFLEFVKNTPGNSLTVARLETAKKENSYDFYKEVLEK